MSLFFFEERSPLGRWSPCTAPDRPAPKTAERRSRKLRAITEVPTSMEHLTLAQLREVFSPDGRFRFNQGVQA